MSKDHLYGATVDESDSTETTQQEMTETSCGVEQHLVEPKIEEIISQESPTVEASPIAKNAKHTSPEQSTESDKLNASNVHDEKSLIVEGILDKVVENIMEIDKNEKMAAVLNNDSGMNVNEIPNIDGIRITYCRSCCSQDQKLTQAKQQQVQNRPSSLPKKVMNAFSFRKMMQKRNSTYHTHKE